MQNCSRTYNSGVSVDDQSGTHPPSVVRRDGVNFLNCVSLNARSIVNKLPEWYYLIYACDYDIILVTESWLNCELPSNLLDPHDYFDVIRCDRSVGRGGGVCCMVAKKLGCHIVDIPVAYSHTPLELCCFDICFNEYRLRFFNAYSKPGDRQERAHYMRTLVDCLSSLALSDGANVLVGDMNCGNIDWVNLSAPNDGVHDTFLNFTVKHGYSQLITEPTRDSKILDVLLSNEPISISDVSVLAPFSNSDHSQVGFRVFVEPVAVKSTSTVSESISRCWKSADFDGMSRYLSMIDWDSLFTVNFTADSIWNAFCNTLNDAIDMFVPVKNMRKTGKRKVKHYPNSIKRALTRKKCLWRKHRNNPENSAARTNYKLAASKCKMLIRNYEIKKERKVIEANNTGDFYKFVNRRLSCRSGVGALRDNADKLITDDKQRADMLNQFFGSVGSQDDGNIPDMKSRVENGVHLDSVRFDCAAVMKALKKLKPNLAAGPDRLPPLLFKRIGKHIAKPLSLMFSSFLSIHQIPKEWSKSIVTPVFKTGRSCDVENYRPISLTCVACKVMERVIADQMLNYLRAHNLISKHQHGFMSRHSTVSNLLESVNDWTLALNNNKGVAIAYIDYAKAFDVVCHSKLLLKLSAYGITGDLIEWIRSFLSERTQCTRVNQSYSNYTSIVSGVIQGSVLGPLLFLLYINDVTDIFNSSCVGKLYADDIKLYSVLENPFDYSDLQSNLSELQQWSDRWQLNVSYKKCNVLCLSNQKKSPQIDLVLGNSKMPQIGNVRDLGVIIDSRLKFDIHINQIVTRAHRRANLIHKCFTSKDSSTLMRAFVTYVRPILEYASCVWSPYTIGQVTKIEAVQRRFTKRLLCCCGMQYPERLAKLGVDSLELRRLRFDLIYVYKILFGMIETDVSALFVVNNADTVTRGHNFKLFVQQSRIDVRKYFFSNRVVQCWNSLPATPNDFSSLGCFRRMLQRADLNKFKVSCT